MKSLLCTKLVPCARSCSYKTGRDTIPAIKEYGVPWRAGLTSRSTPTPRMLLSAMKRRTRKDMGDSIRALLQLRTLESYGGRAKWLHVILRYARLEEQYVGNGDWGYFKQLYLSRKGRKLPAYAAEIMLTLVFQRKTPYNRKGMSNCKFPLNGITGWILLRQNRNRCLTQNLWRWSCLLAGCL